MTGDNLLAKRVTIMIDRDIDKKIRNIQAETIKKTEGAYSFSLALNTLLRKQLKL